MQNQYTLKQPVEIKGIGLHSGCAANMVIKPAPENYGIRFVRSDISGEMPIRTLYSNVVDTRNCTCLGTSPQNIVSTIEHIMSVFYILGIDNALVEINNPEIPILDGSGQEFLRILKNEELEKQNAPRKFLKVKKEIRFEDGKGASISLFPADSLRICFDIEFPSKIVGHQTFDKEISLDVYSSEIAPCRTFCEKYQVDYLRSVGLIKGGSLDNAVVLDGDTILNPGGFRVQNECVNHKVMDTIGDLYTSGYYILAKVVANKSGHFHNNEVLKRLFSSDENYELL